MAIVRQIVISPKPTTFKYWISLALVLIAFTWYLALDLRNHGWAFDDEDYIENAKIAQSRFSHVFSPDKAGAGRPTVHLYFWALYPIFREDAGSYHVANLVVHAVNGFLLASLIYRMGASFWVATSAGLLFCFSLSHFRAIFWISGIGHLLATGFGMTACLALLRYSRSHRQILLWISTACFALASFAHQSAIVFLVLFFIFVFQRNISSLLRDFTPLCAVPIAVVLASTFLYATPLSGDGEYSIGIHLLANLPHQFYRLFAGYFLDPWTTSSPVWLDLSIGLLLISALAYGAVHTNNIRLPVFWLMVSLLPFALWPAGATNWRYYYLPSTGSSILVALLFAWLGERAGQILRVGFWRQVFSPFSCQR